MNGVHTQTLMYTGSSISVVSDGVFNRMKPKPKIQLLTIKAYAFGQTHPKNIKGNCACTIEPDTIHSSRFLSYTGNIRYNYKLHNCNRFKSHINYMICN